MKRYFTRDLYKFVKSQVLCRQPFFQEQKLFFYFIYLSSNE